MISWLKILDLDFLLGKLVIYCSQKNEIGKMYFNLTRSQFNSKESVDDFRYFWKIATPSLNFIRLLRVVITP